MRINNENITFFPLNQCAPVTAELVDKIILINDIGYGCFIRSNCCDGLITDRYGPERSLLQFGNPG